MVSTLVCRLLGQWLNSHSEHEIMHCHLVMHKYSGNLYFSIIDAKLMFVEIDSTSAWR